MSKLKTQREFIIELMKDGDMCMDAYICPNCKDLLNVIVEGQRYQCENTSCLYNVISIDIKGEIIAQ